MLQILIANREVEATDVRVEYAISGIQSAEFQIPYQEIPAAASVWIHDADRQYFLGQHVRHARDDDGRVQVEAWASDAELRRKQFYEEALYENQDGGAIVRNLLAGYAWADVTTIAVDLGTIAAISFLNRTPSDAIQEIAELLNLIAYWEMTTGKYRLHAVGDLALPEPLPESVTSRIIWSVDETEIWNVIEARGGEVGGVILISHVEDATSIATYGRRERPVYQNAGISTQDMLDQIATSMLAMYMGPIVSTRVEGVTFDPTGPNGSPAEWIGRTVEVTGTTNDGTYLVAATSVDFDNLTMDLTLSNRPLTFEGAIKAIEKQVRLLQENERRNA